jgi:hypothetical protein
MESASQHTQLRDAADAARPTLSKLRDERERLVRRLRDVDQSIHLLQGVIEAWERIERSNDPLVAQLQRIDQELRAFDSARPGGVRQTYTGVERRTSPRPPMVMVPLSVLPPETVAPSPAVGRPVRGAVLERARRILQTGRERTAKPG